MPSKPKKPCSHPVCPELTTERYCESHRQDDTRIKNQRDKERGTASQRGYDSRWRKARKMFLSRYPLCKHCEEGQFKSATVVDHIIPHKGNKELFWDESNWQPLCAYHHNVKTASEDGGFGNAIKNKDQWS